MSTPARQPDASTPTLADRIRQEFARAASAGGRPPGRPSLAVALGVTPHQVRKTLAEIASTDGVLAIVPASPDASAPAPTVLVRQPAPAIPPAPASPPAADVNPEFPQVEGLASLASDPASGSDEVRQDDASTPAATTGDTSPAAGEPLAVQLVASAETLVGGWRRLRRAGDASTPAVASGIRHRPATWGLAVLGIIAIPAFIATWAGWVGLGGLTGFGVVRPLPGIADSFEINTAVTLPLGVEAYAFLAVGMWLSGRMPTDRARRFAMVSGLLSLALGMGAQVAFHLLSVQHGGATGTPWQVVMVVACLPNTILGMASILAHLARTGAQH